jgi:hypothetical protein
MTAPYGDPGPGADAEVIAGIERVTGERLENGRWVRADMPEGPVAAMSVALSRVLGEQWPVSGPPDTVVLRIHPALWNEIRGDPRNDWRARIVGDGPREFLPSLWFGIPIDVTADLIPGHLAELTVPHPDDPGQFRAHCVIPANAGTPGAVMYPIPPAPADPGALYERPSTALGLWQDPAPGPLETARQVYERHLAALAGESTVNLNAAFRYLQHTYGIAEADAHARVEDEVDLTDPGAAAAAVGRVYDATLEVARELLRRQLARAIQVLALYGIPVDHLAELLNGATELDGVSDLDAIGDDVAVTVAAGPGRIPELWLHAAPGVWVGPAGADPMVEDLTAEQVTGAQARELAAAAWKRAGRDVG